jgi:STE24 endopeptidase
MNTLLLVFILLLVLKLGTSIVLDLLNLRYAQARSSDVPDSFRDFIDLPTYQKSVDYTVAKTRFGIVSDLYNAGVLVLVLLLGVLPWFFELFTAWFGFGVWGQALVLFLIGLVLVYLRFLLTGGAPSILKNVSALTKARKNYGSLIR